MKFGTLVRLNSIDNCDDCFSKVKDLGLESCQLVFKPEKYNESDAEIIIEAAKKNNIEISAFFAGYKDDFTSWDIMYDYRNAGLNSVAFAESRLKYLIDALPFVNKLGVTDMIIHAGFVPNDPFSPEYAELLCKIKILVDRAKKYNVNILFETGGESPITLLRLIKDIKNDNVYVNLDTGNLIMYGYGNPCEAIITLGRYIRNIHAKDGVPPTDPYVIGGEKALGQGVVDFKKVFQLLKAIKYDRFITIEREITGEEQTKDIINGFNYLKNIINNI